MVSPRPYKERNEDKEDDNGNDNYDDDDIDIDDYDINDNVYNDGDDNRDKCGYVIVQLLIKDLRCNSP